MVAIISEVKTNRFIISCVGIFEEIQMVAMISEVKIIDSS